MSHRLAIQPGDEPTPRQAEVLDAIRQAVRANGVPPTVRELGKAVGIASPNAVTGHLASLRKRGLIAWESNKARSIRVLDKQGHDDRWIAVTDFMPSENGVYLIFGISIHGNTEFEFIVARYFDDAGFLPLNGGIPIPVISHWKTLVAPSKGGQP